MKATFTKWINNIWVFWSICAVIIFIVLLLVKVFVIRNIIDVIGGLALSTFLVYPVGMLLYALYQLVTVFRDPFSD